MVKVIMKGDMRYFRCPACGGIHGFNSSWQFNEDLDNPTVSPSLLVTNNNGMLCHSFIVNGKIQFLEDCRHELAGQTVELPQIDPIEWGLD